MSAVDELLASSTTVAAEQRAADGDIERDHWGRYLIPVDGKKVAFTRATTVAKTLSDTFGLEQWGMRMVAKGLALRPDLFARVAATPVDATKALNGLCEDAKEAANASQGRNLGTALHTFTEAVDRGEDLHIPAPWDADVAAYRAELVRAGVRIVPGMIENVVCLEKARVAGTFDRLVTLRRFFRLPLVADLKTGKLNDWQSMAIQLAQYAHADFIFDYATGERTPMPEVDQTRALIIHLPPGQATCTLYLLDIEAGWEAVHHALWTREWRNRPVSQALAVLETQAGATNPDATRPEPDQDTAALEVVEAIVDVPQPLIVETNQVLRGRLGSAVAAGARNITWPVGVPKFADGGPTTWAHVLEVEKVIQGAEAEVQAPFLAPLPKDPTKPAPEPRPLVALEQLVDREPPRPPIPAEDLARLQATHDRLPVDLQALALEQVAANGVPTDRRQWSVDHTETIEHVLHTATELHATRIIRTKELLGDTDDTILAAVLRLLDIEVQSAALTFLTGGHLDLIGHVLEAVDCGALGVTLNDEGISLVSVNPAAAEVALLIRFGRKTDLVTAAKTAAESLGRTKPRSTAEVVGDPLLVAALLADVQDPSSN